MNNIALALLHESKNNLFPELFALRAGVVWLKFHRECPVALHVRRELSRVSYLLIDKQLLERQEGKAK